MRVLEENLPIECQSCKHCDSLIGALDSQNTLTPKELLVLGLVLEGLTNKEVSIALGISEQTAKNHVSEVIKKTGYEGKLRLIVGFLKNGNKREVMWKERV